MNKVETEYDAELRDLEKKYADERSDDQGDDSWEKWWSAKEARDFIENAYGAYYDYGEFDDKFSNMYEKGDFDAKYTKSLVKKSLQKAINCLESALNIYPGRTL